MVQITGEFHLTKEDVAVVQQAIREGRVLIWLPFEEELPYDSDLWDEEAIRDWLERTHLPKRAKQILSQLRRGQTIKSRPISPTVEIALRKLVERVTKLEQEVALLKASQTGKS